LLCVEKWHFFPLRTVSDTNKRWLSEPLSSSLIYSLIFNAEQTERKKNIEYTYTRIGIDGPDVLVHGAGSSLHRVHQLINKGLERNSSIHRG